MHDTRKRSFAARDDSYNTKVSPAFAEHEASRPWDGFVPDCIRPLSLAERERFSGKRILITGAGGYLGSALARALAALPVAHLVLLDQGEYGLYRLDQSLRAADVVAPFFLVVGSVLDRGLLRELIAQHTPDFVFHVAALKHVPLMEANPFAAVETNAFGTLAVMDEAEAAVGARLVLVSTDKAVEPVSIMGASKRIAEQILLRARRSKGQDAVALRMCNVLGSSGSVAPWFAERIARGETVPLTDRTATRFFITAADAVRCIARAALLPCETGLLVPRLGQPRRVLDLAEFLMSRQPSGSSIVATQLRPGEKLHEKLLSADETAQSNADPQMLDVHSPFGEEALASALESMTRAIQGREVEALRRAVTLAVPFFGALSGVSSEVCV